MRLSRARLGYWWRGLRPAGKLTYTSLLAIGAAVGITSVSGLRDRVQGLLEHATVVSSATPGVTTSSPGNPATMLAPGGARLEVKAEPRPGVAWALTFATLLLLGIGFFGLALHTVAGRTATLQGKHLAVNIYNEVDSSTGVERCSIRYDFDGLVTVADKFVLPLFRNYYYPTHDGVDVLLESLQVQSATGPGNAAVPSRLDPVFVPTKVYMGEVILDLKPGLPASLVIGQQTAGNFCTTKARHQKRWNVTDDEDSFTWISSAAWREVRVTMTWSNKYQLSGDPWVTRRRGEAGTEQRVTDPEVFNPKTWTLKLTDVEPEDRWIFHWKLA